MTPNCTSPRLHQKPSAESAVIPPHISTRGYPPHFQRHREHRLPAGPGPRFEHLGGRVISRQQEHPLYGTLVPHRDPLVLLCEVTGSALTTLHQYQLLPWQVAHGMCHGLPGQVEATHKVPQPLLSSRSHCPIPWAHGCLCRTLKRTLQVGSVVG